MSILKIRQNISLTESDIIIYFILYPASSLLVLQINWNMSYHIGMGNK